MQPFSSHPEPPTDAQHGLRERINTALFDLQTPLGQRTNAIIMMLVVASVMAAMIATLAQLPVQIRAHIERFEFAVSIVFAVEYVLRIAFARRPLSYIFSFYGFVDLVTWLPLLLGQGNVALRLLRIIRLLKLLRYMGTLRMFLASMRDAAELVVVVVGAISVIAIIAGNLIHIIEPETFHNAFLGTWWALVTMTTVGYGDMVPQTGIGMSIAAALMMTGIVMFAVLTGTIAVKVAVLVNEDSVCANCAAKIRSSFNYCPRCGASHAASAQTKRD
jgi:voltage-gated potassium channel